MIEIRWLAVVKGALMRGLESADIGVDHVQVHGRVARKSYGLDARFVFEAGEHEDHRKLVSKLVREN